MKYKNIPCPICGSLDKGKRKICEIHKIEQPYVKSEKRQQPFSRTKLNLNGGNNGNKK